MKILFISHMYPTPNNKNYGIFVHQQARALVKEGCHLEVVSPKSWTPFPLNLLARKWRNLSLVPPQWNWQGIRIHYPRAISLPRNLLQASSGIRYYHGIKGTVRELFKDFPFELIHAHVALPDGWAATKIASELKLPCVLTVHGQDLQTTVNKNQPCKKAIELTFLKSEATILVSKKLKKLADSNFPKTRDKHVVIHNGVNLNLVYTGHSPLLIKYASKKVVLSVSNLKKSKGLGLNIEAVAQLHKRYPSLHYLVIGEGPEKESLQVKAKELKVFDRVEFLGELSHSRVMEYISMCDIFSLPSWKEGFGVVYLEAMAHGKPVIAIRGEGIDGIIEDKKTGLLVEPRNSTSLAKCIQYYLDNPEKAEQLGRNARKLVHEEFSWSRNAEKNIALYKQVLQRES